MSTLGELIDRAYREYLTRPNDQPPVARLAGPIAISDVTVTIIREDLLPEELSLLLAGTVVEVERELMRVTDFDPDVGTTTVIRAVLGTEAVPHPDSAPLIIAPSVTRQAVYDAMIEGIDGLYPDLWLATSELMAAGPVVPAPQDYYLEVISAIDSVGEDVPVIFKQGFAEFDTLGAVQFNAKWWGQEIWVSFKRRVGLPTDEGHELADLGMPRTWEEIALVSAVASVGRGREIDLQTVEYLTEALEAQGVRPGQISEAATTLLRYREYLVGRARAALQADFAPRVVVHSPI